MLRQIRPIGDRLRADAVLRTAVERAVADPRTVVPGDTDETGAPLLRMARTAQAVLAVLEEPLRRICQEHVDYLAGRLSADCLAEGRQQALADVLELVDARRAAETRSTHPTAAEACDALAGQIARLQVAAVDARAEAWR
jgi:hypothetical protein